MISTLHDARLLTRPDSVTSQKLGAALRYAYTTFPTYCDTFERAGVGYGDLSQDDPLAVLERLPVISADTLARVSEESLSVIDGIVDMETSSGTTGIRKKRFISYEDDRNDHDFMAELFRVAGITAQDRVACLDTDPVYLMVSFARALDLLGVDEAYVYSVGRDQGQTLDALARLDPTAIFAVPSMFERCWPAAPTPLRRSRTWQPQQGRLPGRASTPPVEGGIGVQARHRGLQLLRGGGDLVARHRMRAHAGIHLYADRNLFELTPPEREGSDGQLVVTSLVQKTVPLVRYALGDEIVLLPGECSCGLSHPRVDVLGRAGDSFSILGSKFHYDSLLRSVYRKLDEVGYMQVVLTTEDAGHPHVLLPGEMRPHEKRMKDSLLSDQLELEFLVTSKLTSLRFDYVDESYFTGSRKMKLVDDRRER